MAYVAKGLAMGQTYSYPGLEEPLKPEEMPPSVDGIRRRVEETMFGSLDLNVFDSAHLNMYRGEHDHISWHSDDDVALYGNDPIIASVSLGATRRFVARCRRRKTWPPRPDARDAFAATRARRRRRGCPVDSPWNGSPRG